MAAGFRLDKDDAIYKYHVRLMMMTITKKIVQVENSGALKNHDCYMRLQDKTSQPLLNAWPCVV